MKDVSERIDDIMRGKVLELPSEKLINEVRAEGYNAFLKLIKSGVLSLEQAASAVEDKTDFLAWFRLQK